MPNITELAAASLPISNSPLWTDCKANAQQDPSVYFMQHEEFLTLDANWSVTEDDAADTQAVGDAAFGELVLTCKATTDNDACQVTYAQEMFKLVSGKKMWFEARIKCPAGDATNLDFFIGLCEAEDLTGVADNMPANGIGFHKDDGDTNIDLSSSDNGTNTQRAAVATLVDATWIRLGFKFNGGASGAGTITPYVDDVAGTPITVTYATMAEMAPMFMVRNGDATTTQALHVDYVKVVVER